MEVNRFHLGPSCDAPLICFVTGRCYSAALLGIDEKLAEKGVTTYALEHVRSMSCDSRHCRLARWRIKMILAKRQ